MIPTIISGIAKEPTKINLLIGCDFMEENGNPDLAVEIRGLLMVKEPRYYSEHSSADGKEVWCWWNEGDEKEDVLPAKVWEYLDGHNVNHLQYGRNFNSYEEAISALCRALCKWLILKLEGRKR